jgi:hypothetical protein
MMTYNIYCDESCHLENDKEKAMAIGGVWCPENKKDDIFKRIREIKQEHGLSSQFEIKWNKVSLGQLGFYIDVVNYFFDNSDLHFRVIVVPNKQELDHERFHQSHDDFYYKLYFDMLKTIFDPDCRYNIYLDMKDTRSQKKVDKLHEVLCNNHYDFKREVIRKVQQVRSHEVELIALSDLLIGAISYLHRGITTSRAKLKLIERIKTRSEYNLTSSTLFRESKFNVFVWKGSYGK